VRKNKKLDAILALFVALFLAAAASAGGKQSAPVRLFFAIGSLGAAGLSIELLSKLDREEELEAQQQSIALERAQVYAQADLEADRTIAHFRSADRLFQENPELVDYFTPTVTVSAEPVTNPDGFDDDGTSEQPGTVATMTKDGLFDWTRLQNADEHPVLAIIAPMGGGKSRLAKYLAKHVLYPNEEPEITVYDIYGKVQDWTDAKLVTEPGAMIDQMNNQLKVITQSIAAYRQGQTNFSPKFTIFEEAPGTLPKLKSFKKSPVEEWLNQYTTVTRKVRDRLCLISVRAGGVAIGTGAEARDDCTIIFAGWRGVGKATKDTSILKLGTRQNQQLRERLEAKIKGLKHPALIYVDGHWFAGSIPELDEFGNPIESQISPKESPVQTESDFMPSEPDDVSEIPRELRPIAAYIEERGTITLRALKKNFGCNNKLSSQDIDHQIDMLQEWLLITIEDGQIKWSGD
jgi:hypothetical protein